MLKFVILASGTGTNARALLQHAQKHGDRLKAVALISDRAEAGALEIAREFQVPSYVVASQNESSLLALLQKHKPDWACLAGYKKLVGQNFLQFFAEKKDFFRVMNVHPSLLPAYPGLHGYERAYKEGVRITGVTVHLVDAGLDTGKVILQESFEREEEDSLEAFKAKGQKIEHKLFCKALDLAEKGKLRLVEKDGSSFISHTAARK